VDDLLPDEVSRHCSARVSKPELVLWKAVRPPRCVAEFRPQRMRPSFQKGSNSLTVLPLLLKTVQPMPTQHMSTLSVGLSLPSNHGRFDARRGLQRIPRGLMPKAASRFKTPSTAGKLARKSPTVAETVSLERKQAAGRVSRSGWPLTPRMMVFVSNSCMDT